MSTLYLLRHAKSDRSGSLPDHDRPLAPRGRRAAPAMAEYMKSHGLLPELVLCSTAARAKETWDLMRDAIGHDATVIWEEELYGATAGRIVEVVGRVSEQADSVMVVGHNPGMEDAAEALAGEAGGEPLERMRRKFPSGALAVLETDVGGWDELEAGTCRLERFVRPKDLPDAEDRGL